jgi:ferritin-like protein 2
MTTLSMAQKLNAQMNLEFSASHLYVSLSNWCMERNLFRPALYLRRQAQNCITHTMRVFEYMKQTGNYPIIKSVSISQKNIHSLDELLKQVLANQLLRRSELEYLAEEARVETDNPTLILLADIHAEQNDIPDEIIEQMAEYLSVPVSETC